MKPARLTQPSKRAATEMANSSAEELTLIAHQLEGLTEDIRKMRADMKTLVNKEGIEDLVKKTVTSLKDEIMKEVWERIDTIMDEKIAVRTRKLSDKLESLEFENKQLNDKLGQHERIITECKDSIKEKDDMARDAMKKANYNEQFSRKNNVKIMDITEDTNESEDLLTTKFIDICRPKGVTFDKNRIMAIHRLPGLPGKTRPVIVKLMNNNDKAKIMRKRSEFKTSNRLVDDVTKLNTGLIRRISQHPDIDSAWFFNGAVYGKTRFGRRYRFDIYDEVDAIIRQQ
ncbi:MAG: hypothetical protein ABW185_17750 [Sedimenticola sp.]